MSTCCKKVLLLAAISLIFICILRSNKAYAISKASLKTASKLSYSLSYKRQTKPVSRSFTTISKNVDRDKVVYYAKMFLGTKYVYGASGPDAFDCSGFTKYVMSKFGIYLPHSAREQFSYGEVISRENLKQGDLIYFDTSGGWISHTGIYIGDNKFIHASSKGVIISSLEQKYYSLRYVAAIRLII